MLFAGQNHSVIKYLTRHNLPLLHTFFFFLMKKNGKSYFTMKKNIFSSKRYSKHPLAGRNTQHLAILGVVGGESGVCVKVSHIVIQEPYKW